MNTRFAGRRLPLTLALLTPLYLLAQTAATPTRALQPSDVWGMEYVRNPAMSPNGKQVAYERVGFDIMTDKSTSDIYLVGFDGSRNRPLIVEAGNPKWSRQGDRIAFTRPVDDKPQIFVRYLDGGEEMQVTKLQESPSAMTWSPDGKHLAFVMPVAYESSKSVVQLPPKPAGAKWAGEPIYIDRLKYRADGGGYLKPRFDQLFVVSTDGGTARQVTYGAYDHSAPAWTPDGKSLLFSANASEDELNVSDSNLGRVMADGLGKATWLTTRVGPDDSPKVSPSGKLIAYSGFDDKRLGYHNTELYVANLDGSNARSLTQALDRSVDDFQWTENDELIIQYDTEGDTYLARVKTSGGKPRTLAKRVGGQSLGRPYSGGQFSAGPGERFAFTLVGSQHPADLAVGEGDDVRRVTRLNEDLDAMRDLGTVEELYTTSSVDQRRIQSWVLKPADFDASKKYPLILEIHGGPYTNYGDRFSLEDQLYAAAGYVVLYVNPRGSTSYGADFANLIENDYPGKDYNDLMDAVDATIAKGYVDSNRLYVTGGSGGGVLTAWIVGNTDRFKAAVVAKPVINWASFALYADNTAYFTQYWFEKPPYEDYESYWKRSPLSIVGKVKTPTMLLTGEQDYRTPIAESEQYFAALKLAGVETAMVRIQDSGHGITNRPSNLMAKVSAVLGWFERH